MQVGNKYASIVLYFDAQFFLSHFFQQGFNFKNVANFILIVPKKYSYKSDLGWDLRWIIPLLEK
jgi:hypothetical protein